jgi:hypothetical protein
MVIKLNIYEADGNCVPFNFFLREKNFLIYKDIITMKTITNIAKIGGGAGASVNGFVM